MSDEERALHAAQLSKVPEADASAYLSGELTHFVGRDLEPEEQYKLMLEIVRSGWLTHKPHLPRHEHRLRVFSWGEASNDSIRELGMVCFCDIPLDALELHMSKYSRFGLAFPKAFLVAQGVAPVFYVAINGLLPKRRQSGTSLTVDVATPDAELPDAAHEINDDEFEWLARGRVLDEEFARRSQLYRERRQMLFDESLPEEVRRHLLLSLRQDMAWEHLFWSFIKCFDSGTDQSDARHYYAEREWRGLFNVEFRLADLARIVVPRLFEPRLRADLPEYTGEVLVV